MYTTHDLSGGPDDSVDWSARFFSSDGETTDQKDRYTALLL